MSRTPSLIKSAMIALFLAVPATQGSAELTSAEALQVEKLRGVQVLSSDGGVVGLIEGASISPSRAALFLRSANGSFLRYRGKDVVILTQASEISLQGNSVVLNSTSQRIKTRATKFKADDDMIEINLPRR